VALGSDAEVGVGTTTYEGVKVGLGVLVGVGVGSRLLTTITAKRLKMR